jgi:protein AroM
VRPLPSQLDDACLAWARTLGQPVAAAAASPYTDSLEEIGASAASIAEHADLLVLDCIGYDERMRRAAAVSLAARLAGELLTRGRD